MSIQVLTEPRPVVTHTGQDRKGYEVVGREIFAVDTQALSAMRVKNLSAHNAVKKEKKRKETNLMPRDDQEILGRSRGPVIIDYNENMVTDETGNLCNGSIYTAPFDLFVPLRTSVTKDRRSLASTIYGGKLNHVQIGSKAHKPGSVGLRYRNPKTTMRK